MAAMRAGSVAGFRRELAVATNSIDCDWPGPKGNSKHRALRTCSTVLLAPRTAWIAL